MELNAILKRKISSFELIEDVGFADLSEYRKLKGGKMPSDFLSDAKTGIVYIARMNKVIEKYGKWYVVTLNNFLKQYNEKVVNLLKDFALNSTGVIDERFDENLMGKISFRQLAVLAGLGVIGKSTHLLHPIYGPNVLIGVVLTSADLLPNKPLKKEICANCDLCVKSCPVAAIRNGGFNRFRCKNRRKIIGKGCGTPCITYCPAGKMNSTRAALIVESL